MISFLRLAFYSPPVTARPDPRHADRRIVARLARGDIRWQRGQYVTRADLDAEKARVLTFDFDTP